MSINTVLTLAATSKPIWRPDDYKHLIPVNIPEFFNKPRHPAVSRNGAHATSAKLFYHKSYRFVPFFPPKTKDS